MQRGLLGVLEIHWGAVRRVRVGWECAGGVNWGCTEGAGGAWEVH